jgi:hypothetical protein
MNMLAAIGLTTSVLAALGFYLCSPRCLWTSIRRWRKFVLSGCAVLATLSTGAWIAAFGIGVGLCAMLAALMLCLVVLPWLALLTGKPHAAEHR